MKIAILVADANGRYPVPAVKGGAVATLVEHLVENNENKKLAELSVITYYDVEAEKASKKYKNTKFEKIKIPAIVNCIDSILLKIICSVFPRKKSLSFRSPFSLIYFTIAVRGKLLKGQYSRVIVENNMVEFNLFRGLRKKYGGKYCLHLHNIPRNAGGAKKIIQSCKKILCVSDYVGDRITQSECEIGPIEKERIVTYYNCLDTKRFYKLPEDNESINQYREKYQLEEDDFVLIYAGRLSAEKGIDKLLEATDALNSEKIVVLVVGSYIYNSDFKDAYCGKLEGMASKQQCRVIFTGYIPNNELIYFYNIADIAILPSVWDEPAGLTMIEAMACGTAVITTNAGGIPEYVGDGARVLDKEDNLAQNITLSIQELMDDKEREKLAKRGMKRVQQHFSNNNYLEKLVEILKQ